MGVVGDGTVVAPFANAAMRLLREDWKGKYGPKMLAEELYPILQTGIPQPDQNFQNFITVYAGDDNQFATLIDKYGTVLYQIDGPSGLKPIENPNYPPPKLKPKIVWADHTLGQGNALSSTELDAVAQDPETGATVAGAYVYDPPSGTVMGTVGKVTLYVNFTPTDGVKYRRALGRSVLTVVGGTGPFTPTIVWATPAPIPAGTALDGTQLNATAIDPRDGVTAVPGIFTYTPPSGTVLSPGIDQNLHVGFVPTDTVTFTNASGDVLISVGITFISTQNVGGTGPSLNVPAQAVVTGDLIVVFGISVQGTGSTGAWGVSDDLANLYTDIGETTVDVGGLTLSVYMAYAVASSSGSNGVITSQSGVTSQRASEVHVYRYAHASPYRNFSQNSENPSASTTYSSGTVTAVAGDLVAGVILTGGGSLTALNGFTRFTSAMSGYTSACFHKLSVSGSIALQATGGSTQTYVAIAASFKPA